MCSFYELYECRVISVILKGGVLPVCFEFSSQLCATNTASEQQVKDVCMIRNGSVEWQMFGVDCTGE